ncbi:MAG: hemin uptake protein HemP [Arcobacteraceae bacterium]
MNNNNLKTINTKEIFTNNEKIVEIQHNGKTYFLRITKEDKLILTK